MIDILKYLVNKEVEEIFIPAIVSSLDPLQVKLYPGDDAINVICTNGLSGLIVGSNVIMIKFLNKFLIIGVIGNDSLIKTTLIKSDTQSISTSTLTKVTFDSGDVNYDPLDLFNDANDRIIVPKIGLYEILISNRWTNNTGGNDRNVYIYVNGTGVAANVCTIGSVGRAGNSLSIKKYLQTNDYVEMYVWQDSGSNINIGGTGYNKIYFSVEKVG